VLVTSWKMKKTWSITIRVRRKRTIRNQMILKNLLWMINQASNPIKSLTSQKFS
jgi:hypothetical protein